MTQTVAKASVDTLAEAGVQRICGIVGDSLDPVTDAILRNHKVRWCDGSVRGQGGHTVWTTCKVAG